MVPFRPSCGGWLRGVLGTTRGLRIRRTTALAGYVKLAECRPGDLPSSGYWDAVLRRSHNRHAVAPYEEDSSSEYGSEEYPAARSRATKRSKGRRTARVNHRSFPTVLTTVGLTR